MALDRLCPHPLRKKVFALFSEVMVNGPDDVFVERGSKHPPIGSPMPMNTTFVRRCGVLAGRRAASRAAHTA